MKPSSLKIAKRILFLSLTTIGIACLLFSSIAALSWALGIQQEVKQNTERETTVQAPVQSSPSSVHSSSASDGSEDWQLILVNGQTKISDSFSVELETIQGVQVDARILSDLRAMIEAAKAKGLTLTLSSGYRSKERQAMLFENAAQENRSLGMNPVMAEEVAEQSVARAGHSEHETGLAIDLNGVLETFADTEAYRWLQRHAYEYGFVLRYPEGKEEITGIRFEPWHFRYVGKEHARKMRLLNLCLEEYISYCSLQKQHVSPLES